MHLTLHCARSTCVEPSDHVLQVAAMFGLGVDQQRELTIVPPTELTLRPHQLVFITGASGGGKSTLLQLIRRHAHVRGVDTIDFTDLAETDDRPLVDLFAPLPLERTLELLSIAGLNDAFVMLRKPSQLSDGQRYRLRLARAMAQVSASAAGVAALPTRSTTFEGAAVMLADEFAATLDRQMAAIIARKLRRFVDRTPVCAVLATTHDDLLEPLDPDVLIVKGLGADLQVIEKERG